jgi:hypothetical protein
MTIRQELHNYIDDISENKLIALKPLLCVLADDTLVVETNLTKEEKDIVAQGMSEYAAAPNSFTRLEHIK